MLFKTKKTLERPNMWTCGRSKMEVNPLIPG